MIGGAVGLANLVRDAEVWLLRLTVMVHLDAGGTGALRLVCYLNFTLADLNSRCIVLASLARSAFFIVRDRGQPFGRAVLLLLVALRDTHSVTL